MVIVAKQPPLWIASRWIKTGIDSLLGKFNYLKPVVSNQRSVPSKTTDNWRLKTENSY
jgi:hypothetical protein